jgi:hypothetical protein
VNGAYITALRRHSIAGENLVQHVAAMDGRRLADFTTDVGKDDSRGRFKILDRLIPAGGRKNTTMSPQNVISPPII